MRYLDPNQPGSKVQFKSQYENFIGGKWVPPVNGEYFDNLSPVDGKVFTKIPRSSAADIELALDAAHAAKAAWNSASPTTRSNVLLKIADRLEENLELLAVAETWDNGKPVLGRITKQGDVYLRTLLIHGARSALLTLTRRDDKLSRWASALIARRGFKKACVALAAKNARVIWALLAKGEAFQLDRAAA